jgi:membrane protease YdiL (CAAX protease family)
MMKRQQDLHAASATLILLSFVGTQIICVVCFGLLILGIARYHQISDIEHVLRLTEVVQPALLISAPLFGVVGVIWVTWKIVPSSFKDTGPNGAALICGGWGTLAKGFLVGSVFGACMSLLNKAINFPLGIEDLGGLARMGSSSGLTQAAWIFIVVVLSPLNEEILCRGVLFGGYRKSFGGAWATVLTTLVFLLFHLPQGIRYPPLLFSCTALSVVALWCRLRAGAIGCAVAVHMGANSYAYLFCFLATALNTWV